MTELPKTQFYLGDWLVDPDKNLLIGSTEQHQIESRLMSVLQYLAYKQGEIISIDDLLDNVWNRQVVSNSAIYRAIAELRKVLDPTDPEAYIKTIKKKGYCLTKPVKRRNKQRSIIISACIISIASILLIINVDFMQNRTVEMNTEYNATLYKLFQATTKEGVERYPIIHPDGDKLVYVHQKSQLFHSEILLQGIPKKVSSDNQPLQHSPNRSIAVLLKRNGTDFHIPVWSNSGDFLAFISTRDSECYIEIGQFDRVNYALTNIRKVSICSELGINSLQFSVDDSRLLFTSMHTQKVSVHSVNTDGSAAETLFPPDAMNKWNYSVTASPYSNQAMILQFDGLGGTSFFLYDLETNVSNEVYRTQKSISAISWGVSDNEIVFNDSPSSLSKLNLSTGITSEFIEIANIIGGISYQRNTQQFALEQIFQTDRSIHISSLEQTNRNLLDTISSTRNDYNPQFANTSDNIAFVSSRTGINQVWIRDLSGQERQITNFAEDGWIGTIRWSKNDRYLIFAKAGSIYSYDQTQDQIAVFIEAKQEEALYFSPNWSADNAYLYFNEFIGQQFNQYKTSIIELNATPEFIAEGIRNTNESDNGQFVYFTYLHRHGLFRYSVTNAEVETVIEELHAQAWNSWQLLGQYVYYYDHFSSQATIKRLHLSTTETETVIETNADINGKFSVNNSETLIAYDTDIVGSSDVLLINPQISPQKSN